MEVEGYWLLVTAGHIIHNIETALKQGTARIVRANLIDCLGAGATHIQPIPFPYESAEKYYEYDANKRTDFGFVSIPPLICRNLTVNKIAPVDWPNWMNQESVNFEAFFMLGLPTELMQQHIGDPGMRDRSHVSITPVMLPVQRLSEIPNDLKSIQEPRFYGQILAPDSVLRDIDGMSGGPIIGLRQRSDGWGLYWIVAIQSSWIPSRRIMIAYPFPPLARSIEAELRRSKAEQQQDRAKA
jgi:hypothetical protein